jgi:hypothetical protein
LCPPTSDAASFCTRNPVANLDAATDKVFSFGMPREFTRQSLFDVPPVEPVELGNRFDSKALQAAEGCKTFYRLTLTNPRCGVICISAGSGTPLIKEFVLCTFGTANWTQFCPGMIFENEN